MTLKQKGCWANGPTGMAAWAHRPDDDATVLAPDHIASSLCGYWIWQVRSMEEMEEAVEWAHRCPDPMPGDEDEIEIRPIFEADDFGKELTPEFRAQEECPRAEVERQQKA